jgi:integrase/recombinase XerC
MMAAAPGHLDLAADFRTFLASERNYSPATLENYGREIETLCRFAGTRPLDTLRPADIRTYAARLHQKGLAPRSIARALSAWRSFFAWACRRRSFAINPAAGIRAPRAPRGLPKALSVDHAGMLLDRTVPAPGSAPDLRDLAMFELFYSSGLRLAEVVGLDCEAGAESAGWVDQGNAEVTITGKGGKTRTVPVGGRAMQAMSAWRAIRGTIARPDEKALFVGARGRRISPSVVQTRLKQWARRSGVPSNVHPHVLRHSFATHMLQSSSDLRAVQELLGHANISTTQIYTHLDFQQLARVYDAAHPRAKRK